MDDNFYVLEIWARTRLAEFHAAAARERLLAGLPKRPTLARRALAGVLGLMRTERQRSTPLATAEHRR